MGTPIYLNSNCQFKEQIFYKNVPW